MNRSLQGRTVMVTRPREDAEELARLLEARGAQALIAPAIERLPVPEATLEAPVRALLDGRFAWAIFTSQAGVDAVFGRLPEGGPGRLPVRVAAVGEGTAAALRRYGVEPDMVPSAFTTAALGRALPRGSGRVLLARADIAPDGLDEAIAAKGWSPVRVDAYRTRPALALPDGAARALLEGTVDAVTFTSASTVEGFLAVAAGVMRDLVRRPRVVCIGPVTSAAARRAGLSVAAVARPHTIEGLVAAVERAFRPRVGSPTKEP
jgi:uroporphyrinogen-III synthase